MSNELKKILIWLIRIGSIIENLSNKDLIFKEEIDEIILDNNLLIFYN